MGRMAIPQSKASEKFGARVKEARLRLGLSQIQLWQISGIHFTNIGKIERGEANPALHTVIRLAYSLDVDPAELVSGLGLADLPAETQTLVLPLKERKK